MQSGLRTDSDSLQFVTIAGAVPTVDVAVALGPLLLLLSMLFFLWLLLFFVQELSVTTEKLPVIDKKFVRLNALASLIGTNHAVSVLFI